MSLYSARSAGWELGIVAERQAARETLRALKAARTPAAAPRPKPAPPPPAPPPTLPRPSRWLEQIHAKSIVRAVSEAWGLPPDGLSMGYRTDVYIMPRFAAYWLLMDAGFRAKTAIRALGRRDESTVRWGTKQARLLHETNPAWREKYEAARAIVEHLATRQDKIIDAAKRDILG